jgi:NADPH-dependent curcumin reductase CurA
MYDYYTYIVEDILWPLVGNRIKVQGFNVMQFTSEYPVACRQLVQWIKEVTAVFIKAKLN